MEPDERLKQVRQYAKCFRELDKLQKLTFAKVFASNSFWRRSKNFTKEMKRVCHPSARKTNPDRTKFLDDLEVAGRDRYLIFKLLSSMYIKGELLLYICQMTRKNSCC